MGGIITAIVIFLVFAVGFLGIGFFVWRNILRFAKGVERGIKMVPLFIDLPPPSEDVEVGGRDERDVIQETISQAEILFNLIAGTAKHGFKSHFYGQRHISFEIIAIGGVIRFYAAVPVALEEVVKQAIITAYPGAHIEEVEDHNIFSTIGKISGTLGGELILKESYSYPIATFTELKRDGLQALINALSTLETGEGAGIQLLIRPAAHSWTKASEKLVEKKRKHTDSPLALRSLLSAPFKVPEKKEGGDDHKQLSALEQSILDTIEQKTKHPGYEVLIRVIASTSTAARSQSVLQNLVNAFSLFDSPGLNGFKFSEAKDIENFATAFIFRFFPPEAHTVILNSVELATIFHFPEYQFTHTSQLQRQFSKQVEGPSRLPSEGLLLGYNTYRGIKKEIRLSREDRRRHVYSIGQTGTGKSTLMENMIVQDMLAGDGFAFIDPHGDAAEELLSMVPKNRIEDVIYFNPGDMQFPLGLNMFEFDTPEQKDFLIQEAINMLYRLYDPQHQGIIGPRYEHWFRNASLTLMSDPAGATFIEIPKVFTDKAFQREKLQYVTDPTVLDFWNKEMAQTSDYHKSEILGWFVSKFGAFMSNEMMRNIIGQVKSSLNLREIMDNGKILIANLSKGRVGELNSMLLGMIFVTKFQAAAMSRASIPENQRRDFALYVDEFQNFSTDSFAYILSEARKYHLNLVVANQFIAQLTEEIREAVFGNVGTIISFRSGPSDADFLVKQFAPAFDARDLVNLPNFNSVIRLMIGGLPSQPFSIRNLPPLKVLNPQLGIALKQLAAAKYGRPRAQVEKEIFKRLESKPVPSPFDGLGQSSAARPLPPSARSINPAGSGSSFLDEWLAKRRSQTSAIPQPFTPSSGRSRESAPALPTSNTVPAPISTSTHTRPVASVPLTPARHQPSPFESSQPFKSPKDYRINPLPGDNVLPAAQPSHSPNTSSQGQSLSPTSSDVPTTASSPAASLTAQGLLNEQLKQLEDQTKEVSSSSNTSGPQPIIKKTDPQETVKLQPGEIYIDENGLIHQAEELNPKTS